jgi:hypothetical protein
MVGCAAALTATLFAGRDARACGGCFHPIDEPEPTVITAHRMALSISTTQTILWDQVQYAGAPAEFAWVLPVKPGAYIELSSDAWFEALDAATSARVVAPQIQCQFPSGGFESSPSSSNSGCGCGSYDAEASAEPNSTAGASGGFETPPPVTIVHEGSVGPYATVTVHANVPNALPDWLTMNGFAIDASVEPVINAYAGEGFDFIALKLQPGADVRQMKPVRVVSPGATPVLPLRMVAAGTGASVDITLFVIGEGRWEAANFPNRELFRSDLAWDFATNSSNFSVKREELMAQAKGRTWLTTFSKPRALLSQTINPLDSQPVTYQIPQSGDVAFTIAELFANQGIQNGEADSTSCLNAFSAHAESSDVVVDTCKSDGGGGEECGVPEAGQIDAREFACGSLDDMSAALTGLHPKDVWLTRLESKLPREALSEDLSIQAGKQEDAENWLTAGNIVNPPCPLADATSAAALGGGGKRSGPRRTTVMFGIAFAALGAFALRRARRPVFLTPARQAR